MNAKRPPVTSRGPRESVCDDQVKLTSPGRDQADFYRVSTAAVYCAVCDSEWCRCLDIEIIALREGPPDPPPVELPIQDRVARLEGVVADELMARAVVRPRRTSA